MPGTAIGLRQPRLHPDAADRLGADRAAVRRDGALRHRARRGTADPEAILRRFTRSNVQHPTYRALAELGKAAKTMFLCRYLAAEALRREIHEGLNVVETWNSANGFIFFGKGGEVASNRLDDQEVSVLLFTCCSRAWSTSTR